MTTQKRWALTMAAVLGAGVMAGCPPVPPNPGTQPATRTAIGGAGRGGGGGSKMGEAPVLGTEPVAKGVYVAVDRRVPLTDGALAKARLTRAEVLTAVTAIAKPPATVLGSSAINATQAASATAGDDAVATTTADDSVEAPPEAVKLYLQGRQRFLEGNNSDAMTALEKALALDPQGFTVLRLMGRVSFANSQLARGATYLERAQALRPHDVEVNYLLGRYWLERSDSDRASYYFMQAEDSPERLTTSVYTPLASFYLGIALQFGGYHLAAAREYERFLELSELPVPGYRYDPELSYVISMQWASHLAAAENYARLGDYRAALPHYKTAAEARPDDAFIASRLVNALAHDGQTAPAGKAALALVTATHGGDDAVKLVAWTYDAAGQRANLVRDLRLELQKAGAAGQLSDQAAALTLASTQEFIGRKMDAVGTLCAFLEKKPRNLEMLGQLLNRADTKPAFEEALGACARAIAADREHSQDVLKLFAPAAEGPGGVAYAKGAFVPSAGPEAFAGDYLQALVYQVQNRPPEQITAAFEASLKAGGGGGGESFFPARQAYVSYLLGQEKFDRATAAINDLMKQNGDSPRAWQLQVESEVAQQRLVHALQLTLEARERFPGDVELRMELVKILRLRGQDNVADIESEALIKEMPKYEPAYRALVNSLFLRSQRGQAEASAAAAPLIATLGKMNTELPDSNFGKVSLAILYANLGRAQDSEAVLRSVLAVDPDEPDALVTLSRLVTIIGRPPEGLSLLESALKRKPQLEVVQALAGAYFKADRKPEALGLVKKYAEENPDSESYLLLYAAQLEAQDQRGEAAALLTAARARFPRSLNVARMLARLQDEADAHDAAVATIRDFIKANGETTDRLYLLAHFYTNAGNDDASVAALQRVLAIMPNNIGANNDLGYFWTNAGIHLEQAEPMIRKALDNKPNDPAFLDSLGWLYYKQGKFQDAAALLQKALDTPGGAAPEVIQHLGDALYRLGRNPDALTQWEKALQSLSLTDHLSLDERKVHDYLAKVIDDAKAGRVPQLSPVLETSKAAGPATTPATMPQ